MQHIWHVFSLKPHLQEKFQLSTDLHFTDKVSHVIGLYMAPLDQALVPCVDEKSQIQALDRTQSASPLTFGKPSTRTRMRMRDHKRHRTTSCLQLWIWSLQSYRATQAPKLEIHAVPQSH